MEAARDTYQWKFKHETGQPGHGMPNYLIADDHVDKLPLIFKMLTDKVSKRRRRDFLKYLVAKLTIQAQGVLY